MSAAIRLLLIIGTWSLNAFAADQDWQPVAAALGKAGSLQPGGVYRVGLPRSDLKVSVDRVSLKAGFALGGWLAFAATGDHVMVMGDLVLTEDEVNPVITKLQQGGIDITALHNHLLGAAPITLYMHVLGRGDGVTLAKALHAALALTKTPMDSPAPAVAQPIDFDTASVDQVLGYKGKANGGVYQFSIPRAKPITEAGMVVPAAMGSAIAINFQPTGSGKAAITGDFVLTDQEVNPVIQAMRANSIEITALHSHMLNEQPRVFFMHFWANDDAKKLAKALRAALDRVDVAKG